MNAPRPLDATLGPATSVPELPADVVDTIVEALTAAIVADIRRRPIVMDGSPTGLVRQGVAEVAPVRGEA